MDQVKIRFELTNIEEAEVLVNGDCGCILGGRINFEDLKVLEQYASAHRIDFTTGESDPIGTARRTQEQEELKVHF